MRKGREEGGKKSATSLHQIGYKLACCQESLIARKICIALISFPKMDQVELSPRFRMRVPRALVESPRSPVCPEDEKNVLLDRIALIVVVGIGLIVLAYALLFSKNEPKRKIVSEGPTEDSLASSMGKILLIGAIGWCLAPFLGRFLDSFSGVSSRSASRSPSSLNQGGSVSPEGSSRSPAPIGLRARRVTFQGEVIPGNLSKAGM
jgi:hypothetical protein